MGAGWGATLFVYVHRGWREVLACGNGGETPNATQSIALVYPRRGLRLVHENFNGKWSAKSSTNWVLFRRCTAINTQIYESSASVTHLPVESHMGADRRTNIGTKKFSTQYPFSGRPRHWLSFPTPQTTCNTPRWGLNSSYAEYTTAASNEDHHHWTIGYPCHPDYPC